mmetsp:Transcript_3203/g.3477  ORF Transcript_3203/g.3477 Transcript_3203/m.3477 type:complete len:223 (+) Transcript_3203:60-728(+)
METEVAEPNPTIYINNINEKIKKQALKKLLYMLFSQYGKVVQIIACKGLKMRGQAWVVFQDVVSATNAIKGKQGFSLYGKSLKIQFAKSKSHVTARKEGLPIVKSVKRSREELEEDNEADNSNNNNQDNRPVQRPAKEPRLMFNNIPNKILIAQNLPAEITAEALNPLFQQFPGFIDVRIVPGNRGLAFIEFENEIHAGMALRQLNGFQLSPTTVLNLTYSN